LKCISLLSGLEIDQRGDWLDYLDGRGVPSERVRSEMLEAERLKNERQERVDEIQRISVELQGIETNRNERARELLAASDASRAQIKSMEEADARFRDECNVKLAKLQATIKEKRTAVDSASKMQDLVSEEDRLSRYVLDGLRGQLRLHLDQSRIATQDYRDLVHQGLLVPPDDLQAVEVTSG